MLLSLRILSRKVIRSEAVFRKLPLATDRRDERKASRRMLHLVTQAKDSNGFELR